MAKQPSPPPHAPPPAAPDPRRAPLSHQPKRSRRPSRASGNHPTPSGSSQAPRHPSTMPNEPVIIDLDPAVYRLTAVKKAAYKFGDRCHVGIDLPQGGGTIRVTLT